MLRRRRRAGGEKSVNGVDSYEERGREKEGSLGTYACAGTGFGLFNCFGKAWACGTDWAEVSWGCLEGGEAGGWGVGAQALGGFG